MRGSGVTGCPYSRGRGASCTDTWNSSPAVPVSVVEWMPIPMCMKGTLATTMIRVMAHQINGSPLPSSPLRFLLYYIFYLII